MAVTALSTSGGRTEWKPVQHLALPQHPIIKPEENHHKDSQIPRRPRFTSLMRKLQSEQNPTVEPACIQTWSFMVSVETVEEILVQNRFLQKKRRYRNCKSTKFQPPFCSVKPFKVINQTLQAGTSCLLRLRCGSTMRDCVSVCEHMLQWWKASARGHPYTSSRQERSSARWEDGGGADGDLRGKGEPLDPLTNW